MRVTCLRNVLKFGAMWFVNDRFVGTKLRWVIFPQIFEAPWLRNYWSDTKSQGGPKNGTYCSIHLPSLVAICRRTGRERKKMGVFVCLLFCFYRASICEGGLGSRNSVLLSVCLSVRLSVARVDCDKSKWCTADVLIPHERAITLLL